MSVGADFVAPTPRLLHSAFEVLPPGAAMPSHTLAAASGASSPSQPSILLHLARQRPPSHVQCVAELDRSASIRMTLAEVRSMLTSMRAAAAGIGSLVGQSH